MRVFARLFLSTVLSGVALAPVATHAQPPAYPGKPVKILVPNTPGSSADVVARYVALHLAETWKQAVTVENRPGAGGIVAAEAVSKAPADGLTLLLGADGPITILPSLQPNLPYSPQRDLAPVASLGETDFVLVANPKTGFQTLRDFVQAAGQSPGRYNYASAGNGSPQQFSMELLKQSARIQVTHIPYKGGPVGMLDVVAGQVDAMFIAVGPALPHVKGGKLVALATGGAQRHPLLPGVPTVAETYEGFRAGTWFGLFAPIGTPQPVIDVIAAEAKRVLATPAAQSELAVQGIRATGYPQAQFSGLVRAEAQKYAALVKSIGLTAE